MKTVTVFWLRRDLRLFDNAALYHALKSGHPVLPVFIFDTNILDKLEDKADRRLTFIHKALQHIQKELLALGSTLDIYYGNPADIYKQLLQKYKVAGVYANHDYEPYAKERDTIIAQLLKEQGIPFSTYKDQVIFEKDEVLKDDGRPYTVFTPYSKKWKKKRSAFFLSSYPCEKHAANFYHQPAIDIPSLQLMGFTTVDNHFPPLDVPEGLLKEYSSQRDFPAVEGTSHMSVHLRFGTVSIRELSRLAMATSEVYLTELIWREFYQSILWHFPHVASRSFKPEYDKINWRNNEAEFERWCAGNTGYPIVDAGMRELNTTGFMHNRVRMIVASFLTKHLLIDWRWGEAYFAAKLIDYDMAANNGGWQWAAGSGCDAAPYFRIFNPTLQAKKFDKDLKYIRKWVPELDELSYPQPMVEHEFARKRCLEVYARSLVR